MLYTTAPTTGYRFLSMFLDSLIFMVAMWILSMLFLFPNMPNMAEMMEPGHEPPTFNFWPKYVMYFIGAIYALYFCKDSFNGKSPGKKIMGLQVVNHKTMLPANPWRCIVRNLFSIFWPIEAIVALANPSRRIGDFVAGTEVVSYEEIISENEEVEYVPPPSPKYLQAIISYIVTAMIFSFISIQWTNFISRKIQPQSLVPYISSSYNEEISNKLEAKYDSSFREMMTSDVRVYDKMKDAEDISYVSVILYVNKPLIISEKELYDSVVNMAKYIYPTNTVHGKVQYAVPGSGQSQSRHMVTNVWTF